MSLNFNLLPDRIKKEIIKNNPDINIKKRNNIKRDNLKPQRTLFAYLQEIYKDEVVWELENTIPNKKFRIDIAFPKKKLSVEVVGYAYHAKYLNDFKNGSYRNNIFLAHGWKIIYIPAGDIMTNINKCLQQIELVYKYYEDK